VTSLGILWNLCLRELALKLVHTWAKTEFRANILATPLNGGDYLTSTCSILFKDVFSAVNEKNLKSIESELMQSNVVDVLNRSDRIKISR